MKRREFVLAVAAAVAPVRAARAAYPDVVPGYELRFPRDHGAHEQFRNEWWYATGWLASVHGPHIGFQVTFFRNRPRLQEDNPSAFAPRQLVFAHAAVAWPADGKLRHAQRSARAGMRLAEAAAGDTAVWVGDWSLRRAAGAYGTVIQAADFALDLTLEPTQPLLLQGERGFSRKGPHAEQASYYYSLPNLRVNGTLTLSGRRERATGQAWLDHEWSSEVLAANAVGWDWVGLNLADGGALMVFRIRGEAGTSVWAGGTWRDAAGRVRVFGASEIALLPQRHWRSPRTGVDYPVAVTVRAGDLDFDLMPMMDDQELDARASTGTIYWEGAVRALQSGEEIGRGYLELTGYWRRLEL